MYSWLLTVVIGSGLRLRCCLVVVVGQDGQAPETTEAMLRHFIGRVHKSRFAHPRLVMCAPSGITGSPESSMMRPSA